MPKECLKGVGSLGRWSSIREAEKPLSTKPMYDLWGKLRLGPQRSKVLGRGYLAL